MNDDQIFGILSARMKEFNETLVIDFGRIVRAIRDEKNGAYRERDMLLSLCAKLAQECGHDVWRGKDLSQEEGWQNVIFIELPGGQCSWHVSDAEMAWFVGLPLSHKRWDGHTTEEKYRRVLEYRRND